MNRTLALYFDEQALYGAIKPFEDRFQPFPADCSPTYAFAFFLDGPTIHYGQQYQREGGHDDKRVISDFWKLLEEDKGTFQVMTGYQRPLVELLEPIVSDLLKSYRESLQSSLDQDQINSLTDGIPFVISFSEAIPPVCREKVMAYLRGRALQPVASQVRPLSEHLFHYVGEERSTSLGKPLLVRQPGDYAVIEAFHTDVHLSLVAWAGRSSIKQSHSETLLGLGADPREGVLAEMAVEAANRQLHVLHDQASKEQEYLYLLPQARLWNIQLSQVRRPFFEFSCALSVAPTNIVPVTIDRREVDRLTQDRSQHLFRLIHDRFSRWTSLASVRNWILLGDTLKNLDLNELDQFGRNRIQLMGMQEAIRMTLEGMLARPEKDAQPPFPVPMLKSIIEASKLKAGDKIEFSWPPDRFVAAEYMANGQFRVVLHRNSKIVKGDTFFTEYIKVGEAAALMNIVRDHQVLGNYNSGILKELYLTR